MREHLFRGFHPNKNGTTAITLNGKKIKGEWIVGDCIHKSYPNIMEDTWTEEWYIRPLDYIDAYHFHVLPETVCEYTGLTDKNNTKIFESDVVKATLSVAGEQSYAIGVVVFENGTFKLKVLQSKNTTEFKQYMGEDIKSFALEHNFLDRKYLFEVIGNIYDNPELLNRGAKMQ